MAANVDLDQTAENGKQWRPLSDWEYQIVDHDLTAPTRMANSVDPDQTAEYGKQCRSG